MWIDKLADGIVCVRTAIGPRYIKPSFKQRVYLLWTFRHFQSLPQQVLNRRQQRLIESLCSQHRFVSLPDENGVHDAPIIGTVEGRPPVATDRFAAAHSGGTEAPAVAPLVADLSQHS
jgi:hypothetical protein